MFVTLKDHADLRDEGALSPYQRKARAIRDRIAAAERLRDREEKRHRRLTRLLIACEARLDIAQLEVMVGMQELRGMRE